MPKKQKKQKRQNKQGDKTPSRKQKVTRRRRRNLSKTQAKMHQSPQRSPRRSGRGSTKTQRYPETRLHNEFRSVVAMEEGDTTVKKIISYFEHKKIPCIHLPGPLKGKPCIVITENGRHAAFYDGTKLWNPNDEPGVDGLTKDGLEDLKVPRGFVDCSGPGRSHNMQALALDKDGHVLSPEMIGKEDKKGKKITDEGGQCFLIALGYYQYAVKGKNDMCDITSKSHLEVMEMAKKIYKRELRY